MSGGTQNRAEDLSSMRALKWLYWLVSLLLMASAFLPIALLWGLLHGNTNIKFVNSDGPLGWVTGFGYTFFYFFSFFQFWLILRDALKGIVFTIQNAERFRNIARSLIICGIWTNFLGPLLQGKILFGPAKITFSIQDVPGLVLNWLVAALLFYALAEVFRQGVLVRQEETRLREEQELTV